MAKYYTVEKAKFGGTTGTIIPFTRQLSTTNLPDQGAFKTYLPGGFLRCDGSVYSADLFPSLASIIGIGPQCKFKKPDTTLEADQIQLPDLGSKYIRCSNASGQYLNLYLQQDPTQLHVGVETDIESLIGDSVDISYSGNFTVAGQTGKKWNGNPIFIPSNSGYTNDDFLTEDNFQAHGHDADPGVFTYLGKWKDSSWFDNGESGGNDGRTEGSNNLVTVQDPSSSVNNPAHKHQILLPASSGYASGNTLTYGYSNTQVTPDGLTSTINVTTENVQKLDNAIAPYILVEYIIKI